MSESDHHFCRYAIICQVRALAEAAPRKPLVVKEIISKFVNATDRSLGIIALLLAILLFFIPSNTVWFYLVYAACVLLLGANLSYWLLRKFLKKIICEIA
jgi:hypothetical protein